MSGRLPDAPGTSNGASSSGWDWHEGWKGWQQGGQEGWQSLDGWQERRQEGWGGWQDGWQGTSGSHWDWQGSRGRPSRQNRNARRAADPAVAERRTWREAGWQQEEEPQPLPMPGSRRWRAIRDRRTSLELRTQALFAGQLQLTALFQQLRLREEQAAAAAAANAAPAAPAVPAPAPAMPGAAPSAMPAGSDQPFFSPREASEQGSAASQATARKTPAAILAEKNAALGAEPQQGQQ